MVWGILNPFTTRTKYVMLVLVFSIYLGTYCNTLNDSVVSIVRL